MGQVEQSIQHVFGLAELKKGTGKTSGCAQALLQDSAV